MSYSFEHSSLLTLNWRLEESVTPMADVDAKQIICLCACERCRQPIRANECEAGDVVQNPVFKSGELAYIELAHRDCIPEWAKNDNWNRKDQV